MQIAAEIPAAKQIEPARRKPNPSHKRLSFTYSVAANCSCGWHGAAWCGKGARASANGEWLSHRETCERKAKS